MINAGIIGLGRWGQNLVNSIQGKSDKIRVVAGATRTRAQEAVDYAAKQGFPLVDSVAALLADPKIDAVILATPHTQRVELITAAAKAGKHVFTEKPLTLTSAEAAPCLKVCADHKVTLAVGYNWRFQPALQEIKRMLEDGRLGVLQHIEARDARFEHAVRGVIERGGLERGHLLGEDVHKHLNDEHGGELGWRRAMLTRRI